MIELSLYSLIDITATGIISNNKESLFERNQQRNWETILQLVNLRYHAVTIAHPVDPKTVEMTKHEFGEFYLNTHKCWKCKFSFSVKDKDLADKLQYDFNQVPIIIGLSETASFPDPLIYTKGKLKNTYFKVFPRVG